MPTDFIKQEFTHLAKAIRESKFNKITKEKVIFELITNGVAAIVSLLVSFILHQVFVEKSYKNLWGLAVRKNKVAVNGITFEIISGITIFIIGLFVFTIVENVMEKYFEIRKKDDSAK